jgi:hypothetical protein
LRHHRHNRLNFSVGKEAKTANIAILALSAHAILLPLPEAQSSITNKLWERAKFTTSDILTDCPKKGVLG